MHDIISSDEFVHWFNQLKDIVTSNDLTRDTIDAEDFAEHFLDGYTELESIGEYFDFHM